MVPVVPVPALRRAAAALESLSEKIQQNPPDLEVKPQLFVWGATDLSRAWLHGYFSANWAGVSGDARAAAALKK